MSKGKRTEQKSKMEKNFSILKFINCKQISISVLQKSKFLVFFDKKLCTKIKRNTF